MESSEIISESSELVKKKEYPVRIHPVEAFVPAPAYSGPLKKPLEVVDDSTVSCPERGVSNIFLKVDYET